MATSTTASAPDVISDPERHWLEHVYQGEARQLTVRAVIVGMLIGGVMCLSNLYVVLKTGWSIGVTITACIVAFALFNLFAKLGLTRTPFTPLENNAMSSVASAAGYMTGGGNMAALPALLIVSGVRPGSWAMTLWFATISMLGVFAAITIKRQLINVEQLAFPTGTATAATIKALHEHEGEGKRQGKLLLFSFLPSAAIAVLVGLKQYKWGTAFTRIPDKLEVFGSAAAKWTWSMPFSVLLVGAGMLISFRTGWSLLLGGIVTFAWLAPWMHDLGVIQKVAFSSILEWSVWTGAGILVASGLLSFLFEWRTVLKSMRELAQVVRPKSKTAAVDPMADIECPAWWTPAGFLALGPVISFLCSWLFGIPWWMALLSLPLAFIMGIIASRVTGETDITPTKALGPVTQMIYGAGVPGNMTANIMGANVTGGVGLHAADLLTNLKTGWLLGAHPRKQFYAQMFGCVAGAAIVVPAFNYIVPTADVLGSADFPAPAAQVWAGVSRVLVQGVGALHHTAQIGALCGVIVGAVLTLMEKYLPKRFKAFIPSPSGLGIGFVIPASNSIAFFIGSAIAEVLRRRRPATAEATLMPIGSGFIAGESLAGVAIAISVALSK